MNNRVRKHEWTRIRTSPFAQTDNNDYKAYRQKREERAAAIVIVRVNNVPKAQLLECAHFPGGGSASA